MTNLEVIPRPSANVRQRVERRIADIEDPIGVPGFLDDLRAALKDGAFRPLRVRERKIPKPGGSGKVRKLGIPTIADRVVQAALKLVLEPIFEADFLPVSYGFRPKRRAHDAVAEIHHFGTRGYRWVLDADIEACFDSISHPALMERGCGHESKTSASWRWSRRS
jgi:RNA-directed DNA polymerase